METFSAFIDADFSATHTVTSSALRPHFHSGYVIGYLFSGRYSCQIDSYQYFEFRPGETTLLNPGEVHKDFASKPKRDYLTLNIQEGLFEILLHGLAAGARDLPSFPRPKIQPDPQMARIFASLRQELDGHNAGREFAIRSLVTELALSLLRHCAPTSCRSENYETGNRAARWEIRRAIEFLRDTYMLAFDLDRLAKVAGLSKYYLEKVFKQAVGLSPQQYILQLRVERAKKMLTFSSKSIVDISMELGFFDQSHFSNAFKQFTGISPLAYRIATK
jgi:AraC family transcriptional regulator